MQQNKNTGFVFNKNDLVKIIKNKGDADKIQALLRSRSQGYQNRLTKWKTFRETMMNKTIDESSPPKEPVNITL
jgi:hypothetical protein